MLLLVKLTGKDLLLNITVPVNVPATSVLPATIAVAVVGVKLCDVTV